MKNWDSLIVGWDPGYAHGKAVLITPKFLSGKLLESEVQASGPTVQANGGRYAIDPASKTVRESIVSSVTGSGSTDLGLLSVGNLSASAHKTGTPDRVEFGRGFNYLVGKDVGHWTKEEQRMDFRRLSDSPQLRAVFYVTLYKLLSTQSANTDLSAQINFFEWMEGESALKLKLMVGLPVEVMGNRELALETLKAMRKWMLGQHTFTVNGNKVQFEIADVQVMAQPAGTFFAWGLSDCGEWARDNRDLKAPVGICDLGFNTLDLFGVVGGRVEGRYTGGDTAGTARAATHLINLMAQNYALNPNNISLHEADTLIHTQNPTRWLSGGDVVDLSPLVEQALAHATSGILKFVQDKWGSGESFAYILFTGGGAETLRRELEHHYTHGIVLSNAVMANALGLCRYGQRVWGK